MKFNMKSKLVCPNCSGVEFEFTGDTLTVDTFHVVCAVCGKHVADISRYSFQDVEVEDDEDTDSN